MTRTMNDTWRWLITVAAVAAAACIAAATMAAPAHALAGVAPAPAPYTCTTAADEPNFIGWATLSLRGCIAPGMATTMECRSAAAYRWTGSAWQYHGLSECSGPRQVYVYPYASGWSWIWSQQTGWLAVRSHIVQIRAEYGGGYCHLACQPLH